MPNEWQTVLDELKNFVSDMVFRTYLTNLKFQSLDENGLLTISAPTIFVINQVEKKYMDALKDALEAADFGYADIKLIVEKASNKSVVKKAEEVRSTPDYSGPRTYSTEDYNSTPIQEATSTFTPKVAKVSTSVVRRDDSGLNPDLRLDNYVIGSNNELAVNAARAIIEHPGTMYNPLFLYGGPGCGKTHLIQAIGNEIRQVHPEMKVIYCTIEQFYHEFVDSMRKKLSGFSEKYRNIDVLIIDDFQFIVGKEKSQEEFFHTFNDLYLRNKQVIVTSDKLPSEIASVDQRLSSRLMQGMPIDIQMPDFETRCAILHSKVELKHYDYIDNRTIEYIAENVKTSVRDLEGQLNLFAIMAATRGVMSSELIDDQDIRSRTAFSTSKNLSPKQIIDKTAKFFSLTSGDLLGKSRVKNIKDARQVAMYLLSKELKLSTTKIGQEFSKDHTTIMHGIAMVEDRMKKDFELREQITKLREVIYNE